MELSDEILTEIIYVKISINRTKIVKSLDEGVKIPSIISRESGIRTNHVSKILGDLKSRGLVECINPEFRKGKLYRLTDKGKLVSENLE